MQENNNTQSQVTSGGQTINQPSQGNQSTQGGNSGNINIDRGATPNSVSERKTLTEQFGEKGKK